MDDLHEQLDKLQRAIAELDKACKRVLGFVGTIEYMGISFHVSKRFVIADLSPLAYLNLVEHIQEDAKDAGTDGAGAPADSPGDAVTRLYDRLLPLLSCVHQWTPLSRAEDARLLSVALGKGDSIRPHICKLCTALALEGTLPETGRGPGNAAGA
jgi:hypothetical protein